MKDEAAAEDDDDDDCDSSIDVAVAARGCGHTRGELVLDTTEDHSCIVVSTAPFKRCNQTN